MGCQMTKCSTPTCTNVSKACKLINGKCTSCHIKEQSIKNKS